jgi:hypothetical protein
MKWVVCPLDGDQTTPYLSAVASSADLGTMLLSLANVGDPYWAFETLPSSILNADDIGAKWDGAPAVNSDAQTNRNNVAGLFASPPPVGDTNDGTNVVWKVD